MTIERNGKICWWALSCKRKENKIERYDQINYLKINCFIISQKINEWFSSQVLIGRQTDNQNYTLYVAFVLVAASIFAVCIITSCTVHSVARKWDEKQIWYARISKQKMKAKNIANCNAKCMTMKWERMKTEKGRKLWQEHDVCTYTHFHQN